MKDLPVTKDILCYKLVYILKWCTFRNDVRYKTEDV